MTKAASSSLSCPDSISYYDTHARHFFDTTIVYDLSQLYDLFLPHLLKGAKILDAGCGSGRDSKCFLDQGYNVVAFDGSQKLVKLAKQLTGLPIQHKLLSQVNDNEEFDGIWASASLLHVPKIELLTVLERLKKALKPKGIWYMSFRYGEGEHDEGERYFYDQTEDSLAKILEQLGGVTVLHMTVPETLKSRRGYKFIACVVQKN